MRMEVCRISALRFHQGAVELSLLMTRFSIRFKFLVMLLCVASPAVALVSWLGYSSGKQALTEPACL